MKNKRFLTLVLAVVMAMSVMFGVMSTAFAVESDIDTLNGWTLGEGYSVDSIWVYEGSYSLKHTGAESKAISEELTLEDGVTYYVAAAARPAEAGAKVSIDFAGQTMETTGSGSWEQLSAIVLGNNDVEKITVSATGLAYIDGIMVRPFREGENLITNGSLDNSAALPYAGAWLEAYEGRTGVLKETPQGGVVRGVKNIAVEQNEYYLVSIDVFMEANPPWAYIDMGDIAGEAQIRGTKTGEWHTVSAVWKANVSSIGLRMVVERNWDDPVNGAAGQGSVYFDDISIKKVTLYEDLVLDEGFETSATLASGDNFEWVTVNNNDTDFVAWDDTSVTNYENPTRAGAPKYINDDSINIGEWATFTFTGTQFSILGSCSLDCAAFDLYIDGEIAPTTQVDLARSPWQVAEVYVSEELENTEHVVKLVPALRGERNEFGYERSWCCIDAFKYKKEITSAINPDSVWKLGDGATLQSGTHYLYGKNSLKLTGNAYAVANNGKTIKVEPNSYYYYSAWRFRPGDKSTDGVIAIKDAQGKNTLASITGSRYNQVMWNPAEGTNNAEKKIGQWEQIYGFWFSGDNEEITLYAESTGTGVIYFDDVTFNQFENRSVQGNIFENGDMEGYIPDQMDLDPTDAEKDRVKAQYDGFLADDLANFPTSFSIDNTEYYGFAKDFTLKSYTTKDVISEVTDSVAGKKTISILEHTSGLLFRVESVLYEEYNAYDWTIYAEWPEDKEGNSPVISDWDAIDYTWEGEAPKLHGTVGDHTAYEPYSINVNGVVTKSSNSGRGTSGDSSYFNFQYGDKGIMMAVGWPAYWDLTLDNSKEADETHMTAGQVEVDTYLKPGETFRTPLMAFVHYNGRNAERSTNLWRSWMVDCNVNTITSDREGLTDEKLPEAGIFAATSIQWHEMTRATDENQIEAIQYYLDHNIDLTYWWMDAGWYYMLDDSGNYQTLPDWGWSATGTWVVDDSRFPSKMNAISEFAEQNGIRTLLWFEPERIGSDLRTDGKTIHPDWCIDNLVWYGNKEAVDWTFNRIKTVMEEGGIDMYREDFNMDPLANFRKGDTNQGANRKGITENLHVQGHLDLWDRILEYFPNATIDSCASGGNRNDLESMRRGVPLHKTDHAYGDQIWQQNSAAFFQKWVPYLGTKANGESADDNNTKTANRYSLRTALVGGMVLGYDTDAKNAPIDWDIVDDITEEHKDIMHLLYSDYYVHEDWSSSDNDWSAWQYFDKDLQEGYLIAFRRATATESRTYYPKGLDKETSYKIWFEDANKPVVRTGIDIMKNGVVFNVPTVQGSDILHIQAAATSDNDRALTTLISEVSVNGQYKGAILNSGDYNRFDIHFNMNLRDTLLSAEEGKVEKDVTSDYAGLITIDGKKVSDLLAKDAKAVVIDYDAFNNILNVYVKSNLLADSADHEVIISKQLESDGDGKIEGKTTWNYSSKDKAWMKGAVADDVYVESITVSGKTSMKVNDTQTLKATVEPDDADDKSITWMSENDEIATVDANGKVTAKAVGTVKIRAIANDMGEIYGEIVIMVTKEDAPKPPEVNPDKPEKPENPSTNPDKDNNATDGNLKTGDSSNVVLWVVLAAAALLGAGAVFFVKKRQSIEK